MILRPLYYYTYLEDPKKLKYQIPKHLKMHDMRLTILDRYSILHGLMPANLTIGNECKHGTEAQKIITLLNSLVSMVH